MILYGRAGVCEIESIGVPRSKKTMDAAIISCVRYSPPATSLFIPLAGPAAVMRPLISAGEALDHLERFVKSEPPVISSGKPTNPTAHYHAMLASCRLEDCLLLIREVRTKQRELSARGKRLGQTDSRYLKIAERLICEEFAAVLHTAPDLIEERLYAAMDCAAASRAGFGKPAIVGFTPEPDFARLFTGFLSNADLLL